YCKELIFSSAQANSLRWTCQSFRRGRGRKDETDRSRENRREREGQLPDPKRSKEKAVRKTDHGRAYHNGARETVFRKQKFAGSKRLAILSGARIAVTSGSAERTARKWQCSD